MQVALKHYTRDEYFNLEEIAEQKYEFFGGEIFVMSGGTFNHASVGANVFTALRIKLRGKSCQSTNSDMRIETPSGLITYPDISVFCGKPELSNNQCSLLNPVVIIEVLSPSTRRYDQSDKFLLYRSIATFQDYLLIDSEKVHVQYFHKIKQYDWTLHEYFDLNESVELKSIQETLNLTEIYEGISYE